ncbi:MAG: NAD(P)-dependent oxidoreductase [Candidatus Nanoarchaeia archaeon]|nr:NAD(P)-dependent oxidoreductase [Candidatus Nanoarchaeia archaeon]
MKISMFEMNEFRKERIRFHLKDELREKLKMDIRCSESILSLENVDEYKDSEIIVVFVNSNLNAELLSKFKNLKLIATASTGYDHIDFDYCKKKGIKVANVPSYGSRTVSEFAFAMILAFYRKIKKLCEKSTLEDLMGLDLNGKTIGVIGTGKIGKNMIKIAKGFSMNVLAFDYYPDETYANQFEFSYVDMDTLLQKSDIVSLHLPLTKSTHHLINEEKISRMKKDALIVNVSRGGIIDTDALYKALVNEKIMGACLDVLEQEKNVFLENKKEIDFNPKKYNQLKIDLENNLLYKLDNVIIAPHSAFNTKEALYRILDTTILNIINFIQEKEIYEVK